jgi:stage II sporulation protein D
LVEAAANPALHATGAWLARIPGEPELALGYPLEIRTARGQLTLTIRLPLEEYVTAALAGESASFRSEQSLAAMAVAARTYAVRFEGRHRAEGFDFCDTTHCQDVRVTAISERLRAAAQATEGELVWYQGTAAATFYGKDCGGAIEAGASVWPEWKAPYLSAREDTYCPRAAWKSVMRKQDLGEALRSAGIDVPAHLDSLAIAARTGSSRARSLRAGGLMLSAPSVRFAVGRALGWSRIPSDLYELSDEGARVVFEGRGSGNGVGLCQAGAAKMGEQGLSYRQILAFYYPGTSVGVTAQGFAWQSLGGERVQVITTRPQEDQALVGLGDRMARVAEERSGLHWVEAPRLKVYPTAATFRDATGEPGWVAASARGNVIRLQPVAVLRGRGALDSTVLHELLHALIERRARSGLPLWFREGAVEYLTANWRARSRNPSQTPPEDTEFLRSQEGARRAYATALNCFAALVDRFGKSTVLGWMERGMPPEATRGSARR